MHWSVCFNTSDWCGLRQKTQTLFRLNDVKWAMNWESCCYSMIFTEHPVLKRFVLPIYLTLKGPAQSFHWSAHPPANFTNLRFNALFLTCLKGQAPSTGKKHTNTIKLCQTHLMSLVFYVYLHLNVQSSNPCSQDSWLIQISSQLRDSSAHPPARSLGGGIWDVEGTRQNVRCPAIWLMTMMRAKTEVFEWSTSIAKQAYHDLSDLSMIVDDISDFCWILLASLCFTTSNRGLCF